LVVRNGLIHYQDVFVSNAHQLDKAHDFASGPNKVLIFSRLSICWVKVGLIAAAYECTVRRLKEQPLNSKHLLVIRAKLSRMLGIFKGELPHDAV
jgi:alkylation response protein AidB-like acyl-CoA dehydrogenase